MLYAQQTAGRRNSNYDHMHNMHNILLTIFLILSGYRDLAAFGKCLGKDATYVEKVWNNVYGKFDKAVLHLVVDVLHETKNAGEGIEERLSSALMRMEDTDSALYAAKAVEKGTKPKQNDECAFNYHACTYVIVSFLSSADCGLPCCHTGGCRGLVSTWRTAGH